MAYAGHYAPRKESCFPWPGGGGPGTAFFRRLAPRDTGKDSRRTWRPGIALPRAAR
ncbi:hypothetical protein [Lysobacter gummosus]|uniref:hypothetical protein n=1 Tax=Lysobacter gummosus TaxID=262324 RepID=UPI0036396D07